MNEREGPLNSLIRLDEPPEGSWVKHNLLASPLNAGGSGANVLATDLNGDHKSDLVMTTQDGIVSIALGRGDGTEQAAVRRDVGADPHPGYWVTKMVTDWP